MPVHLRSRGHGELREHLLTVTPGPDGARELFAEVAATLRALGARILHERIFAGGEDLSALEASRGRAYAGLADGVEPTWLADASGLEGPFAGVLLHAVTGGAVEVLGPHLRRLRHDRGQLLALSGLVARTEDGFDALFAHAAGLLRSHGAGLERVARTWLWVDPIGERYAALNRARTRCYRDAGLIAEGEPRFLPASTGIGLRPRGGVLGLEAIAVHGGPAPRSWLAAGNQRSAFAYGSAFSRAALAEGPAGPTLFVSGTAAIDRQGETVGRGEVDRQIEASLANVRALLAELGLDESAIGQGVAYGTSAEVLAAWRRAAPPWPLCPVLARICRPELCFELEVAVIPPLPAAPRAG
jgi:enamine deaminase RidA (YjgF/YER057c/UK114 family)